MMMFLEKMFTVTICIIIAMMAFVFIKDIINNKNSDDEDSEI